MVCLAEERAKPPSETLPPKRKPPSVADVLRRYGPILLQQSVKELTDYQERALRELMDCRTAALGGQSWQCNTCGERHFRFHSCRNRFCPTCSGSARAAWLAAMLQKKLPIGYAHVVFTLPRALSLLAIANPKVAYNLLFDAAWKAMDRAARRLGMKLGAVMTLHTWGQRMLPHVHVHCIVTLGGLALDGSQWVDSPAGMLDGASLADPFRTLYVQGLKRLIAKRQLFIPKHLLAARDEESFLAWLKPYETKRWRVHMTPPSSRYAGPEAALKYVASYVKGAAIGNRRIISDDGVNVSFYYKDYRCNKQIKIETISGVEFVRRFLLHVTPPRFLRVRHRGIFANAQQKRDLARCRKLFGVGDEPAQEDSAQPDAAKDERQADVLRAPDCPRCGEPNMVWIGEILPTADWHLRRYGYFARRTRGSGLRPPSTRAP